MYTETVYLARGTPMEENVFILLAIIANILAALFVCGRLGTITKAVLALILPAAAFEIAFWFWTVLGPAIIHFWLPPSRATPRPSPPSRPRSLPSSPSLPVPRSFAHDPEPWVKYSWQRIALETSFSSPAPRIRRSGMLPAAAARRAEADRKFEAESAARVAEWSAGLAKEREAERLRNQQPPPPPPYVWDPARETAALAKLSATLSEHEPSLLRPTTVGQPPCRCGPCVAERQRRHEAMLQRQLAVPVFAPVFAPAPASLFAPVPAPTPAPAPAPAPLPPPAPTVTITPAATATPPAAPASRPLFAPLGSNTGLAATTSAATSSAAAASPTPTFTTQISLPAMGRHQTFLPAAAVTPSVTTITATPAPTFTAQISLPAMGRHQTFLPAAAAKPSVSTTAATTTTTTTTTTAPASSSGSVLGGILDAMAAKPPAPVETTAPEPARKKKRGGALQKFAARYG